jgi:hypothetical protein
MEQIPTAEEFLPKNENGRYSRNGVEKAMIEFAKLHVEAALKEASENGQAFVNGNGEWVSSNVTAFINKGSILNSYPLDNIK